MTIYFLLYAIFLFASIFSGKYLINDKNAGKKFFCIIAFFSISLLLALRHQSMGHDLRYLSNRGYLGSFDYISTLDWKSVFKLKLQNYEKGYIIFNKLISLISKERQFLMAVCAFLPLGLISRTIYKESISPEISYVVYLGLPAFLMNYSGLRQALAIGICTFSMIFIRRKKLIKFIITVLLATTFHYSSFLFLFAYHLYHFKLKDTARYISVALIPIFYIFRTPLFNIFSKLLKENAVATENDSGMLLVVFSLVYVFCIIYSDGSDEQNGLLNLFLVACLCQTFSSINQMALRVGYYFMMSLIILVPSILIKMNVESNKVIYSAVVIFAFVAFGLYSIYRSTWPMAYPYYFYWETV